LERFGKDGDLRITGIVLVIGRAHTAKREPKKHSDNYERDCPQKKLALHVRPGLQGSTFAYSKIFGNGQTVV
jgi:hypothetical protein